MPRPAPTSERPAYERPARRWIVAPRHPECDRLARTAGVDPLVAQLLLNRGVCDAVGARQFLAPEFKSLLAPDALPGACEAAGRLAAAVASRRKIVIYGDYDVDGVTASAILWHALRRIDADVECYVPSRMEEGYGLNSESLAQLAERGAGTIVTVDCGITAVREAREARSLGVELIISDHHEPGPALPEAACIVHPTALTPSANPHLSGAGVALKIAWSLAKRFCGENRVGAEWRDLLVDATALAALGLVADVVPLVGENRVIASFGLRQLSHTSMPGLAALIDVAGLGHKMHSDAQPAAQRRRFDDYDVGFMLAPRLNAIGRLGHAREAVELLTTADPPRAREIAESLDEHNRRRQSVERGIVRDAEALVLERGFHRDSCRGIVLASREWHAGVIGIVASRIVERFGRPTILIALNGDVGQGSGRSIRNFPLHQALAACAEHLVSHGGHAMAAGLRIRPEAIDAFTAAFLVETANRLTPADLLPRLHLDDEVELAQLRPAVVDAIAAMAPFGIGNARPLLCSGEVELADEPRTVGANGQHLRFAVRSTDSAGRVTIRSAVAFHRGKEIEKLADMRRLRVAFEPTVNEWNGNRRVELRVRDWAPA